MRIPNEPSGEAANVFSDLIRLQSEFHARLAEETLRYFRRIQGAAMPAAPGTVVTPDGSVELAGSGAPGSTVELEIEIENLQRVHCVATPMLSPLVDPSGTTWFPVSEGSIPALVAPGEVAAMTIRVPVPKNLPPAIYRGSFAAPGIPRRCNSGSSDDRRCKSYRCSGNPARERCQDGAQRAKEEIEKRRTVEVTAEHSTGESSRVQLIDESEGPGRTTATLVASLTARVAALRVISGADAIGSLTAGFAALGREVSRTAEGMRLRRGLEAGRAGNNGNALWSALRMNTWLCGDATKSGDQPTSQRHRATSDRRFGTHVGCFADSEPDNNGKCHGRERPVYVS